MMRTVLIGLGIALAVLVVSYLVALAWCTWGRWPTKPREPMGRVKPRR